MASASPSRNSCRFSLDDQAWYGAPLPDPHSLRRNDHLGPNIARSYQGTRNPIWFQDIASGGGTCCFGHNPARIGTVARPRRLVPTSRDLPQSRVQRSREDAVEYGSLCRVDPGNFTPSPSQVGSRTGAPV